MLFCISDFFLKWKIFQSLSSHRIEMCKFDVNTCRSWEHFVMDCVFTWMRNIHVILVHLVMKVESSLFVLESMSQHQSPKARASPYDLSALPQDQTL